MQEQHGNETGMKHWVLVLCLGLTLTAIVAVPVVWTTVIILVAAVLAPNEPVPDSLALLAPALSLVVLATVFIALLKPIRRLAGRLASKSIVVTLIVVAIGIVSSLVILHLIGLA